MKKSMKSIVTSSWSVKLQVDTVFLGPGLQRDPSVRYISTSKVQGVATDLKILVQASQKMLWIGTLMCSINQQRIGPKCRF